jgi:hypothetical protein
MWTYEKARRVVAAYVAALTDDDGAILDTQTIEKPYGWVFFYQNRAYIETGNDLEAYVGNAPLIFDRGSGEIRVTGTALPVERYLAAYEATLPPARLLAKSEPSP